MSQTSAHVDMKIANNQTWQDAFIFGTEGDTTWSFTGQKFRLDVKRDKADVSPLLSLTSDAGEIVVDDEVQRILHINVDDVSLRAALDVGEYVYDLIMYDLSVPPIRTGLLHGELHVKQGITGD